MKTTLEISDSLLQEVRELAACEGVTLQTLMERGLRLVLAEAKPGNPFKLRRASFKGEGMQPDLRDAPWEKIRDVVNDRRGG